MENMELRTMLWLNHGCDFSALYGDDGEMQCARCGIDFLRDSTDQIKETWRKRNLATVEANGGFDVLRNALAARANRIEAPMPVTSPHNTEQGNV